VEVGRPGVGGAGAAPQRGESPNESPSESPDIQQADLDHTESALKKMAEHYSYLLTNGTALSGFKIVVTICLLQVCILPY
jgi:hypothetical protein